MISTSIGHNGGPDLYLRQIGKLQAIDAILHDARYTQTEALVLLGLIVRSNANYENAFPGGKTLALYAKVKHTDVVWKALRRLEDDFKVISREKRGDGRSNAYAIMPQRVIDAIVDEFTARRVARALPAPRIETHPPEVGGSADKPTHLNRVGQEEKPTHLNGVCPDTHSPEAGAAHPPEVGATHPPQVGSIHPLSIPYPLRGARAGEGGEDANTTAVTINCSVIHGPGFKLDFGAIDLHAELLGMPKDVARKVAEGCARDWAANGTRPRSAMAMVKAAMRTERLQSDIHAVRMAQAQSGQPMRTFKR
jgi:hypothetical protein